MFLLLLSLFMHEMSPVLSVGKFKLMLFGLSLLQGLCMLAIRQFDTLWQILCVVALLSSLDPFSSERLKVS